MAEPSSDGVAIGSGDTPSALRKSGPFLQKKGSKRSARRDRAKAAAAGEQAPAWARKKFPKSSLSQQDVLAGLGLLPLPPKPHMRGPILKKLVAEGVLLPNGRPNPNNDKVRAIAAQPGKKKK